MATVNEMQTLIGRRAILKIEKMSIQVKILDVRQCWNRTDCLVCPIAGCGEQWVSCERLTENGLCIDHQ